MPLLAAVGFGGLVLVLLLSVVRSVSVPVPTVPVGMMPLLSLVMFADVEQSSWVA